MKKLIFLPVVLAALSFAFLPGNTAVEAKADENTTLTLNLGDMAKTCDQGSNDAPVIDITTDLVTYGYRGGNPETATYTTFHQGAQHWDAGNIETDNCYIEWAGSRIVVNSDYIIVFMTATENLTLAIDGVPTGDVAKNYFKYFVTDSSFDLANPVALTSDFTLVPSDNAVPANGLTKNYALYAGETFMFAYGKGTGPCNLQGLTNVTFTLTSGISATTETFNVEDFYCRPAYSGWDQSSTLATYGVRFGTPTETNPYSVGFTHTGDGKYNVEGVDNAVEWWKIALTQTTGLAFAVTAKERITVSTVFDNVTSAATYGWIPDCNISYNIYRSNSLLKNVYASNITDNLATDIPNLNYAGLIELLPGDILYVGINLNPGITGSRSLELQNYNNVKITFTEVLMGNESEAIVSEWMALRAAHEGSLCDLTGSDKTTLENLIERYEALPENEKEIVGRTIDVKGYTIQEGVYYFQNNVLNFNNPFTTMLNSGTNLYVAIAVALMVMVTVSFIILRKKNLAK